MRFCRCGEIYRTTCPKCQPGGHRRTTSARGYGWDHRKASERYRTEHPLCEACVMVDVVFARPATAMHHIRKIAHNPSLRMKRSNWLAVCDECHVRLEDDVEAAMQVKRWSDDNYTKAMGAPA